MPKKANFEFYPEGETVAGVEILALIAKHHTMRGAKYRIKLRCCGEINVVDHRYIRTRELEFKRTGRTVSCKICCKTLPTAKPIRDRQYMRRIEVNQDIVDQRAKQYEWANRTMQAVCGKYVESDPVRPDYTPHLDRMEGL